MSGSLVDRLTCVTLDSSAHVKTEASVADYEVQALDLDDFCADALSSFTGLPKAVEFAADLVTLQEPRAALSHDYVYMGASLISMLDHLKGVECPLLGESEEACVTRVECLTGPDALKPTYLMNLTLLKEASFYPGEAFGLIAPNDAGLVLALCDRLALDPTSPVVVQAEKAADIKDSPKTLQDALLRGLFTGGSSYTVYEVLSLMLDLTSLPQKAFLRTLADHASEPRDKKLLLHMSSRAGTGLYDHLKAQYPNLLDLLYLVPSCRPPLALLLTGLSPLLPRYFSLTNASVSDPHVVQFCFSMSSFSRPGLQADITVTRKGMAAGWLERVAAAHLASASQGSPIRLPIFRRSISNGFTLPKQLDVSSPLPIVMVATGSGIAPFMSFLAHRQHIQETRSPASLFYGCRDPTQDYLFQAQLGAYHRDSVLTELFVAFSRYGDPGSPRYVQDAVRIQSDRFLALMLDQGAILYICGGDETGMMKDLQTTIIELLTARLGGDPVAAATTWATWIKDKRILRDIW